MENIDERIIATAEFITENKATVRAAAQKFGISKSTVHSDMNIKLRYIDEDLYEKVREVLSYNLSVRHIRGGMATREKYHH